MCRYLSTTVWRNTKIILRYICLTNTGSIRWRLKCLDHNSFQFNFDYTVNVEFEINVECSNQAIPYTWCIFHWYILWLILSINAHLRAHKYSFSPCYIDLSIIHILNSVSSDLFSVWNIISCNIQWIYLKIKIENKFLYVCRKECLTFY